MSEAFAPRKSATAFDQASTVVAVVERSGKAWRAGAIVPGVSRRPSRQLAARDIDGALRAIDPWKNEASKAGHDGLRVVVGFEAGLDGLWIARVLRERGIEVYVMHPASISVERRGRRAKTDRIDVDILLRALLGWLRGEPRHCTMAPIPERGGGGHARAGASARGRDGGASGGEPNAQASSPASASPIFGRV